MNPALTEMLSRYRGDSLDEYVNALREVIQELALLGLWRGKFFEHAAFYGGTALRVLYGLDRFSEDMDFSTLRPEPSFDLGRFTLFVEKELESWGFDVVVKVKEKTGNSAVESAFLKANTREQLLVIDTPTDITSQAHGRQVLKVKLEVDTDPPPHFATETKFCLRPIPFSVRAYAPPALFAGKMHALLCRGWGSRVKGRDWYDFVWYVARDTPLDLRHLEARMRQSGHYDEDEPLTPRKLQARVREKITSLDVDQARADVERFLDDDSAVRVWSREFFVAVADRVRCVDAEP